MVRNWQCSSPQPDQWLKGNIIGSGSFGIVHLAIDSHTGSLFVAKTANSKAGIISLENEANILQNLDSPYITKCIGKDFSLTQEKYSLFFEYMAGGSLSDLSQKFGGTLNGNLIRLYTREILQGLKYLHENGILHSDIKCKNVLLGSSGNIKLADFGCAKRLINDTKMNTERCLGGTPLWMAPEVLRNERLDFAADIWSLGCTVIEMATGKAPWGVNESNPTATMLKIAQGNEIPQFPGNFSPDGLDFLAKCLERDYRKRWTCEKLLEHPFLTGKKALNGNLRKDIALSPTSVLDVASYNSDCDEFVNIFSLFGGKLCVQEKKLVPRNTLEEHLELSDADWITVRSS